MIEQQVYVILGEALYLDDVKPSVSLRLDLNVTEHGLGIIAKRLNKFFALSSDITEQDIKEWSTPADIVKLIERRLK